jgi:hypothetical protein
MATTGHATHAVNDYDMSGSRPRFLFSQYSSGPRVTSDGWGKKEESSANGEAAGSAG